MNEVAFLCHPHHRGGVTRWMVDAAEEFAQRGITTYFFTVQPEMQFISGGGRPLIIELFSSQNPHLNIIATPVNFTFELGLENARVHYYVQSVRNILPKNTPLILSDDEVIWKAGAILSNDFYPYGILHSDHKDYFRKENKYGNYLSGTIAVSSRIAKQAKYVKTVIPCGIPFSQSIQKSLLRGSNDIVWIGRIEEESKRISDIPKIVSLLIKRVSRFRLIIIGHGPQEAELKEEIKQRGLTDNVIFTGWLEKKAIFDICSSSSVLLLTSNYEGMPIAVMEALSCGCGIVSSKVSGVEDLEEDVAAKDCLRLFEIGDTYKAAENIIEIFQIDPYIRSEAAYRLFEKKFTIRACIEKYIDVIDLMDSNNLSLSFNYNIFQKFYSYLLATARYLKFQITK